MSLTGRYQEAVLCPIHHEGRPSMSVNIEKGVFFCFACEARGTAVDLIMAMESCDREQALKRLEPILRDAGHEMKRPAQGRYRRPGTERAQTSGRRFVPPGRRSA